MLVFLIVKREKETGSKKGERKGEKERRKEGRGGGRGEEGEGRIS